MATLTVDEVAVMQARIDVIERRVAVIEHDGRQRPTFADGVAQALTDSPGIVVDEGIARATPCECLELAGGGESDECYSKGVVGRLDEGQRALYCNPRLDVAPEAGARARAAMYDTCGRQVKALPPGDRLAPFFSCIDKEQRARGIEAAG